MRIPEDKVEEVRAAADIVEVVSDYVALKKKGANFFGLCPFHSEKTPSFSVNPDRDIYKCFGCGKGGNVFGFLMDIEKIGFVEVVRMLADRTGVPLPEEREQSTAASSEIESIYHALRLAARFFHAQLTESEHGAGALAYLENRGFTKDTIRKFGLGYAPGSWDALLIHATENNTATDYLHKAGLVIERDGSDGHYDRFRDRVMFPLMSQVGQVVGFTGRVLSGDSEQAKYVNTPETRVYHKGNLLYGLNFSKNEIRRTGEAYVVEGNTDVVSLVQHGVLNVVATSGTALTPAQVKLIGRYTDTVVLLFDADTAGVRASLRGIDLMLAAGMKVQILHLPDGTDPDTFVGSEGRDGFMDYADKHRSDFVSFRLSTAGYVMGGGDPEDDWEAIKSVLSSIALIPNAVRRESYLRLAAEQTGMATETLRPELRRLENSSRKQSNRSERARRRVHSDEQEVVLPSKVLPGEEKLVRLMLLHGKSMIGFILANLGLEEFTDGPIRRTVAMLLTMYNEGDVDTNHLLEHVDDEAVRAFAAGLLIDREQPSRNWKNLHQIDVPRLDANPKRSATDSIRSLKLERVKQAIRAVDSQLRESAEDSGLQNELMKQAIELQRLKKDIASGKFLSWTEG